MAGEQTQAFIAQQRSAGKSDLQIFVSMMDNPKFAPSIQKMNSQGVDNRKIAAGLGLNILKPGEYAKQGEEEVKRVERQQAKDAGKTKAWESALLGFSDLGAGVIQGVLYAKDAVTGGDSYDKFTKQRADIENYHEMRRQESNQGFDGWRLVGNVAGTAPLGAAGKGFQGARILSGQGAKVLAQNAGVGAAIGGSGFAENANQRTANTILGGVGGAGGAAVGGKAGQFLTGAMRRLNPNTATPSQIDAVINIALNQSDNSAIQKMTVADLSQAAKDNVRNEVKNLLKQGKTPDQKTLERLAVFSDLKANGLDLKPTGKQATGDPKLWTKETELSKLKGGGALADRYVRQGDDIVQALADFQTRTGGVSAGKLQTGESVIAALNRNDEQRRRVISDLYKIAKDHTGNDLTIGPNAVIQNSKSAMTDAFINPDKMQSALLKKLQPFIDPNNPKPFTLRDKETFVKQINNTLSKTTDGETRYALSLIRQTLEQEADTALSRFGTTLNGDAKAAWDSARKSASDRFGLIDRMPALQKAIDDDAPDKFFQQQILSANVRDVKALADEIKNDPQAFNNVRQEIIRFIANKTVSDTSGNVSPKAMSDALKSIGDDKLKIFFSADELKHLQNLRAATKYLFAQPRGANVNNSNSASAFANMMNYMGLLKNVPVIGPKINQAVNSGIRGVDAQIKISQGSNALQNTATRTPSIRDQQTTKWLMQMGLLGGANAANE